jgi:hypothetical protein
MRADWHAPELWAAVAMVALFFLISVDLSQAREAAVYAMGLVASVYIGGRCLVSAVRAWRVSSATQDRLQARLNPKLPPDPYVTPRRRDPEDALDDLP